jgi:hypothetical protein
MTEIILPGAITAHIPTRLNVDLVSLRTPLRFSVVAVATVALYVRMPGNFTMPQFWAEDGLVLFKQAADSGWASLTIPAAGYFVTLQRLIAFGTSHLSPSLAPAIYNYFAFAFTLVAVWLATSPRLALPFRPLIALAIVVVPAGYEILGSMGNTQWIVPIIVLLLFLMRPSKHRWVTIAEILACVLFSVTGPFAVFLVPLGAMLAYAADEQSARTRLMRLTAAMLPGLLASALHIIAYPDLSMIPYGTAYIPSPPEFWVALPLRKFLDMLWVPRADKLGLNECAMLSLGAFAVIFAMGGSGHYRKQKLAMIFLGSVVMISGMIKYRGDLPTLLDINTTRYFYAANVFLVWVLCCSMPAWVGQRVGVGALVVIELFSVFLAFDTPRIREDFKWQQWAAQIPNDKVLRIPIAPRGWFISLNAHVN